MVKGVNKTVIEVNNTGSRLFEKIVFYVTPEYGNLNAKQLKRAASAFTFQFEEAQPIRKSLRGRHAKRQKKQLLLFVGAGLLLVGAAAAMILIL